MSLLACAVYSGIRWQLIHEFDQSLATRLRSLAVLVQQEGDQIKVAFSNIRMQEFARTVRPDYYQIFNQDGNTLARSRHLTSEDLPVLQGALPAPVFKEITLPDGRPGRAAGIRFQPAVAAMTIDKHTAVPDEEEAGDAPDDDLIHNNTTTLPFVTLVIARDTQDLANALSELTWLLACTGIGATRNHRRVTRHRRKTQHGTAC